MLIPVDYYQIHCFLLCVSLQINIVVAAPFLAAPLFIATKQFRLSIMDENNDLLIKACLFVTSTKMANTRYIIHDPISRALF